MNCESCILFSNYDLPALILLKLVKDYSYILHLINFPSFVLAKKKKKKKTHDVNTITDLTAREKNIIQRTCIFYR